MSLPAQPSLDQMETMEAEDRKQADEEILMEHGILWPPQEPSHTNGNLVMVSVHAACEELWRCQELQQAASWLQLLHHAVLRDRLEAYDPSEAFLCLQGAALRFHDKNVSREADIGWAIWEESMWAAAALARVCVGPAWRLQLNRRRSWLYGNHNPEWQHSDRISSNEMDTSNIADQTPREVLTNNEGSPRSYSPMTSSSFGNLSASRFDTWYPPIPEVLPAAMLRFAASSMEAISGLSASLDRQKHIADAQRELVLALCCTTSEEAGEMYPTSKRGEWTIPGAHDPVARMLLFWMETATTATAKHELLSPVHDPSDDPFDSASQKRVVKQLSESAASLNAVESALSEAAFASKDKQPVGTSETQVAAESNVGKTVAIRSDVMQAAVVNDMTEPGEPFSPATPSKGESVAIRWDVVPASVVSGMTKAGEPCSPVTPSNTAQVFRDSEPNESPSMAAVSSGDALDSGRSEEIQPALQSPEDSANLSRSGRQSVTDTKSASTGRSGDKEQISCSTGEEEVGTLDWWYVLQITRAATDLVSSGWRLPPRGDAGSEIVLCLLDIAEKGLSLRPCDLMCAPGATDREAREERLAAASSAAEALSALASLGASGSIPHSTQSHTVAILCRLQATLLISAPPTKLMYPLGNSPDLNEQVEWELEKETFTTQRESCSADMADLFRVLLSHQSSAATSVLTVMRLIDVDLPWTRSSGWASCDSSLTSSENSPMVNGQSAILDAAMAIRVLAGSLWGEDSTNVSGVASLRVFWLPFLDVLCKVGYLIHSEDMRTVSPNTSPSGIVVGAEKPCNPISYRSALILAVEIASALRRLVYTELVLGDGLLTPCEWDAYVLTLDQSVIPWLSCVDGVADGCGRSAANAEPLSKRLRTELCALLTRLGEFLDRCARLESGPFHLLIDDTSRRQLHLLLLRKAIPYMQPVPATALAVAVIQSWAAVGFLPSASADWCQVASDIFANAFAVYENRTFGFAGGFVHSPRVRLEALMAITHEGSNVDQNPPTGNFNEEDSFNDDNNDSQIFTASPLTLTKNVREKHLDLIEISIIPYVISILGAGSFSGDMDGTHRLAVLAVPSNCYTAIRKNRVEDQNSDGEEFELRLYALKLLGRLFRSTSCERRHRSFAIQMLGSVVSMNGIKSQSGVMPTSCEKELVGSEDKLGPFSDEFYLSLEAIREMELCLYATFRSLPHAHRNVPQIIDALCSVIGSGGWNGCGEGIDENHHVTRIIRSMAALLPLCRLSMSHDRHLVLIETQVVSKHALAIMQKLRRKDGSVLYNELKRHHDVSDECITAPFVTIGTCDQPYLIETGDANNAAGLGATTETTIVSFDPIVSVIMLTVKSLEHIDGSADKATFDSNSNTTIRDLRAGLLCTCFDAISNFILSGVGCENETDSGVKNVQALMSQGPSCSLEEKISRCRAVVAYVESFYACFSRSADTPARKVDTTASGESLVTILLGFAISNDENQIVFGCRGLSAVLPLLSAGLMNSRDDKVFVQALCTGILNRLQDALHAINSSRGDEGNSSADTTRREDQIGAAVVSLLSILYTVFSGGANLATCPGPDHRRQTINICHEICSSKAAHLNWFCHLVGLQCAAAVVDRMEISEVSQAMSFVESSRPAPSDERRTHDSCDYLRLPGIVLDLLMWRRQHLVGCSGASTCKIRNDVDQLSTHEVYAKETDDIDHFVVESKKTCSAGPNKAWMHGDRILTCRLGASTSRYRGWMEVIVRSPSSRKRHLVRLSGRVSLGSPGSTSSLWYSGDHKRESESLKKLAKQREDSDVISKALSTIERCDACFANLGIEIDGVKETAHPYTRSPQWTNRRYHQQTPGLSSAAPRKGQAEKVDDKSTNSPMETSLWRSPNSYGEDETARISDARNEEQGLDTSIHHWLNTLLSDKNNVRDVEDQLRHLGFTDDLLTMAQPLRPRQEGLQDDFIGSHRLIRPLHDGPKLTRALSILDRTTTLLTHKVALLFAGQASIEDSKEGEETDLSLEDQLLRTTRGSAEFLEFTSGLSSIVLSKHLRFFSGGLDTSSYSADGKYAASWIGEQDRSPKTMVLFHLVTLMPTGLNNRKRHVGNDNVHIVYVEQGHSLQHEMDSWGRASDPHVMQSSVVSGEFGFVTIFAMFLKHLNVYRVSVRIRKGLPNETIASLRGLIGTSTIAKAAVSEYVRRVAVMADLACRSTLEDRLGLALNWEERRTQIREMWRYAS